MVVVVATFLVSGVVAGARLGRCAIGDEDLERGKATYNDG